MRVSDEVETESMEMAMGSMEPRARSPRVWRRRPVEEGVERSSSISSRWGGVEDSTGTASQTEELCMDRGVVTR